MKKLIAGIFMSTLMFLMSFGMTAFAAESEVDSCEATAYTMECTSDGIVSITDENGATAPASVMRSTISGYTQQTISGSPAGIVVYPTSASGAGGMGVTIECSSSWNGAMSMDLTDTNGNVNVRGVRVVSNGTSKLTDMYHDSPSAVVLTFRGIPSGQSVFVKVWIYG
ncbi:MAG: hypothetical protein J6A89_01680 [Clostridia bacterium]|nr:hypothetical protein [Clostridia bacterium]